MVFGQAEHTAHPKLYEEDQTQKVGVLQQQVTLQKLGAFRSTLERQSRLIPFLLQSLSHEEATQQQPFCEPEMALALTALFMRLANFLVREKVEVICS